jgi:hypothetical protein
MNRDTHDAAKRWLDEARVAIVVEVTQAKGSVPRETGTRMLVGTSEETALMRAELKDKSPDDIEVLAQLALNETSIPRLLELLHEQFVNGVIISAKHSYFEQVESVLQACEMEGVEAWLVADFFKTQIFRRSFDDFYGRPVLVFRTTPEASWQGVIKQIMDFVGAFLAQRRARELPLAHGGTEKPGNQREERCWPGSSLSLGRRSRSLRGR